MTTRVWRALRRAGSRKVADPVGDGLEAGQRRAAVGERLEDDDEGGAVEEPGAVGRRRPPSGWPASWGMAWTRQVPHDLLDVPGDDDEAEAADEEVGREGEELARPP